MDNRLNEEKQRALRSLKTARGQIEGIIKMIEEGKYCVDISNQMMSTGALLKNANLLILKQHLHRCVLDAVKDGSETQKMDEVMAILAKLLK